MCTSKDSHASVFSASARGSRTSPIPAATAATSPRSSRSSAGNWRTKATQAGGPTSAAQRTKRTAGRRAAAAVRWSSSQPEKGNGAWQLKGALQLLSSRHM